MPDRYGDGERRDYRPIGAKLDIGGLPVCDSTHPLCCRDLDEYRKNRQAVPRASRAPVSDE